MVKRSALVMARRPVDSASAIRFIRWWGTSMRWSADTSLGERTASFTLRPRGAPEVFSRQRHRLISE